jgi:hypothetical protein
LWRIIEAAKRKEMVRTPLLSSLRGEVVEEDANQVCQLAAHYAQEGDSQFANALRGFLADRRFPQCPWLGEEELLRLEGESGLVLAARVRGVALLEPGGWFDDDLVRNAVGYLGEQRTSAVLAEASQTDAAVRRYYEAWRESDLGRARTGNPRQAYADRMRAIDVEEVIAGAESGRRFDGSFRGWGMHADEGDLRTIAARIRECRDPKVLANYLRVFSNRPLPEFDEWYLDLLTHPDEEVRRRAVAAVAMNSHPSIRDFIERAKGDFLDESYLELFTRSFQTSDEEVITSLLPDGDEHRRHSALYDTLDILERNSQADCSWLGYVIYESTPCGSCRNRAAKLLIERDAAPEWIFAECRFDAEEDTRTLAGGPACGD